MTTTLRKTKIICTLGPATESPERLREMIQAGTNIFRLNMSHATHDAMRERLRTIRRISKEFHREIGILVDLQGPKLRVGQFQDGGVDLQRGQTFVLDADTTPGDIHRVNLPHPEILRALAPGHTVLIDDGKIRLHITEASPKRAVAMVDAVRAAALRHAASRGVGSRVRRASAAHFGDARQRRRRRCRAAAGATVTSA